MYLSILGLLLLLWMMKTFYLLSLWLYDLTAEWGLFFLSTLYKSSESMVPSWQKLTFSFFSVSPRTGLQESITHGGCSESGYWAGRKLKCQAPREIPKEDPQGRNKEGHFSYPSKTVRIFFIVRSPASFGIAEDLVIKLSHRERLRLNQKKIKK